MRHTTWIALIRNRPFPRYPLQARLAKIAKIFQNSQAIARQIIAHQHWRNTQRLALNSICACMKWTDFILIRLALKMLANVITILVIGIAVVYLYNHGHGHEVVNGNFRKCQYFPCQSGEFSVCHAQANTTQWKNIERVTKTSHHLNSALWNWTLTRYINSRRI